MIKMNNYNIYIWQYLVSPHVVSFANALHKIGFKVIYVAEQVVSEDRRNLGWVTPHLDGPNLRLISKKSDIESIIGSVPKNSIHLCQGIRGNGLIGYAQKELKKTSQRQFIIMETVDDSGLLGVIKRLVYRVLFFMWRKHVAGVFAIGSKTENWIISLGMPESKVFPFTYFLAKSNYPSTPIINQKFRFIFVGGFIKRKRLDFLITALAAISNGRASLAVVGSGPMEGSLKAYAESSLTGCVEWIGRLSSDQVSDEISRSDCLVLPSIYDGWGAVVSEALLVGVPAICSSSCGCSGVVSLSRNGSVFNYNDINDLKRVLTEAMDRGKLSEMDRKDLSCWSSRVISGEAGAEYFFKILDYVENGGVKPFAPWEF
jgi:glycosyltransferase involved in cell wall biosynthesis